MAHECGSDRHIFHVKNFVSMQADAEGACDDFEAFCIFNEDVVACQTQIFEARAVCAMDDADELFEQSQDLPNRECTVCAQPCLEGNHVIDSICDDEAAAFGGAVIEDAQDMCIVDGTIFEQSFIQSFLGCF